jgi:ABC-type nitrate/sulfonate/bicarbonate transport system substrate-binding protein
VRPRPTAARRTLITSRCALVALAAVAVVLVCAGCGSTSGGDRPNESATLLLDFTPNAVHAGIYLATARGFDDAEGVQLHVRRPSASTDALKVLETGRAEMAILDIHDLGLARERGADVVGVMAVVQRPLAAVLAARSVRGGRAGVALRRARRALSRAGESGAPAYPELVLCTTSAMLSERKPMVRATIRALQRGYAQAQADPDSAVTAMTTAIRGVDRETLAAQLDAVAPAFTAGARGFGELRPAVLRDWAAWDVRFGILKRPPDLGAIFDTGLVGPPAGAG